MQTFTAQSTKPKTLKAAARPQYARAAAACNRFGISRTTLWQWSKRPDFPKPCRVGPKTTLYDLDAIADFIKATAVQP